MWGPLPHIFYKFVCVYVIYVCLYMFGYIGMCVYVEIREQFQVSSSGTFHPYFLRQGSCWPEAHQLC